MAARRIPAGPRRERKTKRVTVSRTASASIASNPLFIALKKKPTVERGRSASRNSGNLAGFDKNNLLARRLNPSLAREARRNDNRNGNNGSDNDRDTTSRGSKISTNTLAVRLGMGRKRQERNIPSRTRLGGRTVARERVSVNTRRSNLNNNNDRLRIAGVPTGPKQRSDTSNMQLARIENGNGMITNNSTAMQQAQDLTFKNASLIPFLRIENLTDDVSESDIVLVLANALGPVLKILKMKSTYKKVPSVTAEVFFLNENELTDYANKLNNVKADGRVLKCAVSYRSQIINSDRLWDNVLKEVRVAKQKQLEKL